MQCVCVCGLQISVNAQDAQLDDPCTDLRNVHKNC